jgi:hypothetical protein
MAQEPDAAAWLGLLGEPADLSADSDEAAAYDFATRELREDPPPPGRDGGQSRFVRTTGVVHFQKPAVANVPASVLPAFTKLRPDFAQLRHVALDIRFMLEEPAQGHIYTTVRLVIQTRTPGLSVEQLWPAGSPVSAQTEGTTTTAFTSQVAGPVQVGVTRTREVGTRHETTRPPTVVDEFRPDGFGWKYQEQPGAAIYAPWRGQGRALLALPRETRTLSVTLDAEVFTRVRRYGRLGSARSVDGRPPAPFILELGEPRD